MAKKTIAREAIAAPRSKPSALVDTRVIYYDDNLKLAKLPDACAQIARALKKTGRFYE